MNTDKEEKVKQLNSLIPLNVRQKIVAYGGREEHWKTVYRVAKWGKLEEKAFFSTYEEIQAGLMPDNPIRYPLNEVGTYSTSVYTDKKSCKKFINLLKGRLRKIYPCPMIICGSTSHGLLQRTIERESDYMDPTHIDWWIYEGKRIEVLKDFKLCGQKEEIE